MEKLLDLLQEFYWENRKFSNDDWLLTMTNWVENLSGAYAQTYIISLKGSFIKWLVENDKIDRRHFNHRSIYMSDYWSIDDIFLAFEKWEQGILYDFEYEDTLLMLLAIQDEPIEFLISVLK